MTGVHDGPEQRGAIAYNVLQQQLITVRGRLDRQVQQLMRLSSVSNELLRRADDWPCGPTFAEVIVDVLDVAVGAVWVLHGGDDRTDRADRAGLVGLAQPPVGFDEHGVVLARALTDRGITTTTPAATLGVDPVPGVTLTGALISPCVGRDGTIRAVVLAANTPAAAAMAEPISDDTAALLGVIAEKCAAHLDNRAAQRRHDADIHRLAFFDPLTDLPNRRLLNDRLHQALQQRDRTGDLTAVVMLDLDRFKTLNDTHGHAAGDQLLRAVGRRLLGIVRPSDTVARLSGDEFVVLLERLGTDPETAAAAAAGFADAVVRMLSEPHVLEVGTLHHSASIGVALADEPHRSADTLLKQADVALYQAKADGRNTVRMFHPAMQVRVDTRSAMEANLREGLRRQEFGVAYQAQVDATGSLVGAEALLRWSPAGGAAVSPTDFIAVAEESGVIHPIGQLVLDTVCAQLAEWAGSLPAGFRVAVNLSASEFLHPEFPRRVWSTLERHGTAGEGLRLEITEATVLTDLQYAAGRMNELREYGIEFSLDDFGTGYSSLTYLRQLPVAEVKIDRSYVDRILVDADDSAIVRAVLALCDALDLRAVAEGVETVEQWAALADTGCRHFQGFLFGRPMASPSDPHALVAGVGSTAG